MTDEMAYTDRDDGLHPYDSTGYYERWYFDAQFNNGYICTTALFWRRHSGSHQPSVVIDIYGPDGRKIHADEAFDAVVSNLVFHEVSDAKDKRAVVREALRVLRKGGKFAFQDLFTVERLYGDTEALLAEIRSWGISKVELTRTYDEASIPAPLKLPFMVGTIAVISGQK